MPPVSLLGAGKYPCIVTSVDDNYMIPAAALLRSIAASLGPTGTAEVCVLHSGLSRTTTSLLESVAARSRLILRLLPVDPERVSHLKVTGHISLATYYRLLLEDALPQCDRVIYLDADTIVLEPISQLWEYETGGAHLLAVQQAWNPSAVAAGERGLRSFRNLGIHPEAPIFNAGVMLIDLQLWRRDHVSKEVVDYLGKHSDEILWWDQDGLNAILSGRWHPLPLRWNVMTSHVGHLKSQEDTPLPYDEVLRAIQSPALVHYSSHDKPWTVDYRGPFGDAFQRFNSA